MSVNTETDIFHVSISIYTDSVQSPLVKSHVGIEWNSSQVQSQRWKTRTVGGGEGVTHPFINRPTETGLSLVKSLEVKDVLLCVPCGTDVHYIILIDV